MTKLKFWNLFNIRKKTAEALDSINKQIQDLEQFKKYLNKKWSKYHSKVLNYKSKDNNND